MAHTNLTFFVFVFLIVFLQFSLVEVDATLNPTGRARRTNASSPNTAPSPNSQGNRGPCASLLPTCGSNTTSGTTIVDEVESNRDESSPAPSTASTAIDNEDMREANREAERRRNRFVQMIREEMSARLHAQEQARQNQQLENIEAESYYAANEYYLQLFQNNSISYTVMLYRQITHFLRTHASICNRILNNTEVEFMNIANIHMRNRNIFEHDTNLESYLLRSSETERHILMAAELVTNDMQQILDEWNPFEHPQRTWSTFSRNFQAMLRLYREMAGTLPYYYSLINLDGGIHQRIQRLLRSLFTCFDIRYNTQTCYTGYEDPHAVMPNQGQSNTAHHSCLEADKDLNNGNAGNGNSNSNLNYRL